MTNAVQKIVQGLVVEMPNNKFAQYLNSYLAKREYHIENNQNAIKNQYQAIVNFYKTTQIENKAVNENSPNKD